MNDVAVPPAVRLVRDFVNTYEPQTDEESVANAASLKDWLVREDLVSTDSSITTRDHANAVVVREGLRNVLLGHAGHDPDPESIEALHTTLAEFPVRLELDADGYRLISTGPNPFAMALGHLLDAIRLSSQDGTWRRLKVCARDTCRWAFYDASRNQVRRWCSMAGCGNYVKMRRAYATRKRLAETAPGGSTAEH